MSSEYLTVKQVAELYRVDVRIARKLLKTKGCPIIKISERRIVVDKDELYEWILSFNGEMIIKDA
jgi:hypothetical protein